MPYDGKRFCAFIDETGNFGYKFEENGCSSHFIVSAVIVEFCKVDSLRNEVDKIRCKYFGNGEMKSSRISRDHSKRFKIIQDLIQLDFQILSIIIDKRKIYPDSGLTYKKTYYKYLNNLLYKQIKLFYPYIEVFSDNHGSDTYMLEFQNYVNSQEKYNLLDEFSFQFVDSKSESLIQVADIIAGTLSFGYEQSKLCNEYKGYYNLLKSKIKSIDIWPILYENYLKNLNLIDKSDYDDKIATHCIRLAVKYIKEHDKTNESEEKHRVRILNYLLNEIYSFNSKRYISANELIKYLNENMGTNYNGQTFKTNIIARLRDEDVIISSSPTGYKIPISERELYSYANKTLGVIMPMLGRLNKCRERILSLTDNNLDILEAKEYNKIKKYFDEVYKANN